VKLKPKVRTVPARFQSQRKHYEELIPASALYETRTPFSFISGFRSRGLTGMNAITNDLRRELRRAQVIPFKTFPRRTVAVESVASSNLIDLEFSDHGRDLRFLPGWWTVPLLVPNLVTISFVMSLLI
jgi:hypothetical protein